ncbi:MAG: hypothetical protein IPP93_06420 [Chitinophagaceae bacterium]|nr:hypothetical protein [Chitinophagaceae bacterium]
MIAPAPLCIVHTPVPDRAVLPARVNVLVAHCALVCTGGGYGNSNIIGQDTSSKLEQLPLVIVQRRTVVCPAVTPITVDVGEEDL